MRRWCCQVPVRRAVQRDEDAIERWRDDVWPELRRRARRERRVLVFVDEAGFYLLPGVVKTYAPEALTPVLAEKVTRDHLSVMGGMTPEGKVYTLTRQEPLDGMHSVEFLLHLRRLAGSRLLVIWDGSPIHRRAEVKEYVSRTRGAVWLEFFQLRTGGRLLRSDRLRFSNQSENWEPGNPALPVNCPQPRADVVYAQKT